MKETFFPIDAVRKISPEVLSSTEKLTLILLLDYLNCREIYVSASKIAEQASLSVPTVERAFRKFKQLNIMSTKKVRRGGAFIHLKRFDLNAISCLGDPTLDTEPCDDIEIDLASV